MRVIEIPIDFDGPKISPLFVDFFQEFRELRGQWTIKLFECLTHEHATYSYAVVDQKVESRVGGWRVSSLVMLEIVQGIYQAIWFTAVHEDGTIIEVQDGMSVLVASNDPVLLNSISARFPKSQESAMERIANL